MPGTDYIVIARVLKARGLEGKVTVVSADGLPFCLEEGLSIAIVPPPLRGVRYTSVSSLDILGDGTVVVGFEGVDGIDDVEELAGRFILARRADLDLALGDVADELLGRSVVDEKHGELGTVLDVFETPANEVLVIQGPYGEVLVPVVDEMVLEIPEDLDLPIRTRVLDGLVL